MLNKFKDEELRVSRNNS